MLLARQAWLMKYLRNSFWMISEYSLRIISSLFVGIYVARYLGPEPFGTLNYAFAIVAIFITLSHLGMGSILVRDLIKHPALAPAYMGTAFGLMILAGVTSLIILSVSVCLLESDPEVRLYILVAATGLFFQAFLVIDYNFQSQLKVKYSSIAKSSALAIGSLIKIYLVWVSADLVAFAMAYAFDYMFIAIVLCFAYSYQKQKWFLSAFSLSLVRPLLKRAWPMMLSALAAMMYVRIDQVMIQSMVGAYELGLYVAASKIFEAWVTFVYIVSISLLPLLVDQKKNNAQKYEAFLIKLFRCFVFSGGGVTLFLFCFGESIIDMTFGEEYESSIGILLVLSLGAPLIALRVVTVRYLTVESLEKKVASRTVIALVLSVVLNYILIPEFGVLGAAVSTVMALFYSAYIATYMDSELFKLQRIYKKIFYWSNS